MKRWILGLLLVTPLSSFAADEIDDTGYLKAFYCYQLAESPRLAIDLSNEEKERGINTFIKYLVDRGLELPKGKAREDVQLKFSIWVMQRMKANDEKIMGWYRANCLQAPENLGQN
ncbi:MAG: hypothetical protein ACREPQ_20590 [Rhodanobacter sp.]